MAKVLINVRVEPEVRDGWKAEAESKGMSLTALIVKRMSERVNTAPAPPSPDPPSNRESNGKESHEPPHDEYLDEEPPGPGSWRQNDRSGRWELVATDVVVKPWGLVREPRPYAPHCENFDIHVTGSLCDLCGGNGLPRPVSRL